MTQSSRTVLMVDDASENRELYRRCLIRDQEYVYTFWEATSGKAGLLLWQQHQPDVVLVDCCLPDMNGLEFLVSFSSSSQLPCSVIAVTGQGHEAIAVQAIEAGAHGYIVKGQVTPERLRLTVSAAISKAKMQQRLEQDRIDLQESEERFCQLAENIEAAFWIVELPERRVSYVSPTYEHLWGLDAQAVYDDYQAWVSMLHPDDREAVDEAFQNKATEGEFDEEYRIFLPDGTLRWIRDRCFPVRDASGRVYRLTGIAEDITKRKQTEEALYLQAQIVDQTHDSVITTNLDGYITSWNRGAERIFGYTAEEAIGQSVAILYPPEMYDFLENQVIAPLKAKGKHEVEAITQRKSGERIIILLSLSLLQDEHQNAIGMIGYSLDITGRKQSEQALRENEQLLRLAMESAHAGSWTWEIPTSKVAWSSENYELHGLDPAQGPPQYEDWSNALHPDDRDRTNAEIARVVEQQLPEFRSEFRVVHPQHGIRWLQGIGRLMLDEQSNPLRLSGINLDITERKQVEAALADNEARLQGFVDANIVGILHGDVYGNIYKANDEMLRIVGYTQKDVATDRLRWLEITPPAYLPLDEAKFAEARAQGACVPYEKEYLRKDGSRVPVLVGYSLLGAAREESVTFVLDLTERKRAEGTLRRSKDRLRMAIESAELGTWDWNLTTNKLTWDPGCKALFGLLPDAKVTIATFQEGIHPDDRERVKQAMQWSLKPDSDGDYNIEYRTVGIRDGVERWLLAKGQAYFDSDNKPRRFIGTVMDITERKQAELERQQSQKIIRQQLAEIEALYQTAPIGLTILDRDLRFVRINQLLAEINGVSQKEHLDRTVREIVPSLADEVEPLLRHAFETGEPLLNLEIQGETAAQPGVKRTWIQNWFPIKDANGKVVLINAVVQEITDRKRAEVQREQLLQREQAARAEAERANRIKDEFLAVLSHELRSPLNPILGWSKLLQTGKLNAAKTAKALETIERNAKLQNQLIDDLLDVARILRGKLKLNNVSVSLPSTIEAAIDTVVTAAKAKSIAIHTDLPDIGQIWGDVGRLQQIVWNLLSNAIKFSPSNGRVDIRLKRVDEQAQITVTDTGKGISPDFLPHIFQSFRQEDASITRQHGGLGLGLAIVQYLVEAHGGTIAVDSPGEGQGATFTVKLPLPDRELEGRQARRSPQSEVDLTGIRALAVDDSPDARELLAMLLTQYGAEVMVVTTAAELLANLEAFQPDILVCDIGLPDIDGYALMRQIRTLPSEKGGQIPAIALTAYVRDIDQQQALDCGYQKHLAKPIDVDSLLRATETLVETC